MDRIRIHQLLGYLGASASRSQKRKGYVLASCPLAPWTHRFGKDRHPSFAISEKPNEISRFNCFTCGHNGGLLDLVRAIRAYNSDIRHVDTNIVEAMALCSKEDEEALGAFPDYDEVYSKKKAPAVQVWPEAYLDRFCELTEEANQYLDSRGLKIQDLQPNELLFHREKQRIVFVIRDWVGRLAGCHTRTIVAGVQPTYLAYKYDKDNLISVMSENGVYNWDVWLGEQYIDENNPVVIAEGPMDWLSVRRVYPNTLCALSVGLSLDKIRRLRHLHSIVTLFDFGTGGDQARTRMTRILGSGLVHLTPLEEYGDAGAMPKSALQFMLEDYVPV